MIEKMTLAALDDDDDEGPPKAKPGVRGSRLITYTQDPHNTQPHAPHIPT